MGERYSTWDLEAAELAAWLRQHARDRWWTVDGDDFLSTALDLPSTGEELADVLVSHGGRLRVFLTKGHPAPANALADIGTLAEEDNGARVFQLAWLANDQPGEPWVLAEDTVAQAASEAARP